MARPKTRTTGLMPMEVNEIRSLFGTFTNAYARLFPGGAPLTWAVFKEAAAGRPSRSIDVSVLRQQITAWKKAHLKS